MKKMTRRDMMVKTGSSACAMALMAYCVRARAGVSSPISDAMENMGGFKVGIQSWSLRSFGVEDAIRHAADMGLHWIEFFPGHFRVTDDEARIAAMNALTAPDQIAVHAHGVHNFGGDEAAMRKVFAFAKQAGIPLITAHPAPEAFPILDRLVKEYDIRVGIHNHGPNHRYDRIEDALKAAAPWDKRIGYCPDTGHCMRSGEDPVEMIEQMADRLYGVHLKDQTGNQRGNPPEAILGEGALDLAALCKTLRKVGFVGPLSIEYERNPKNPIADIRKGMANFAAAAKA